MSSQTPATSQGAPLDAERVFLEATTALLQTADERFAAQRAEMEAATDGIRADLATMRAEAATLLSSMAISSLASGYAEDAKHAGRNASIATAFVVSSFATSIGVSIAALHASTTSGQPFDWKYFLARASVSAIVLGLGAYLSSVSNYWRERRTEAVSRKRRLQMFLPYIEPLPEEQQNSIRAAMAEHFFTDLATVASGGAQVASSDDILKALELLKLVR